jgi:Tol biopolymer transport system component
MHHYEGRIMRKLIVLLCLGSLAAMVTLATAGATPRGANGRILFGRFDPAQGDTVIYTANPDGSHEQQLLPFALECPHWSADGSRIVTCGMPDGSSAVIINPDTGSFREVFSSDPTLFLACSLPSPDGQRLACGQWNQPADPSRNGIYSIRSSDGGGLLRITSNPGGSDEPGDYSPNGKRLVFGRSDQNGDPGGLFVVNVNGTGLKQITPKGTPSSQADWSPQGNEIVFSQHLTPNVHSSIWVVHADGTGLHEIHVQPESACGGPNSDPTADGCFEPRWSPDGTKIIFAKGTSGDSDSNIYTVNVDGTGLTQVTHGARDQTPDWGTHPVTG